MWARGAVRGGKKIGSRPMPAHAPPRSKGRAAGFRWCRRGSGLEARPDRLGETGAVSGRDLRAQRLGYVIDDRTREPGVDPEDLRPVTTAHLEELPARGRARLEQQAPSR